MELKSLYVDFPNWSIFLKLFRTYQDPQLHCILETCTNPQKLLDWVQLLYFIESE